MFDCEEEFSKEQLEEIKIIIKTDTFQEVNSIVHICDLSQNEDKIIKNVKDYIWIYLSNYNSKDYSSSVDNFISFFEHYYNNQKPIFTNPSSDGKLSYLKQDVLYICNGHHIHNDFRYLKSKKTKGLYMKESYLGCDHRVYLSKKSMLSRTLSVSDETKEEVDYNSILAESIFNYFEQPVASYYLFKDISSPYNKILTPVFLGENQELIHLDELYIRDNYIDTHYNRMTLIIDNLIMRYKDKMNSDDFQKLIDKISLQYAIQSFIKLFVGPMDCNFGNTAIVLTHNNTSIPSIDLAPAFDLDISFNISDELVMNNRIDLMKDINYQPSTIMSLMKEFKDVHGFKEFVKNVVNKLSNNNLANELLDNVYRITNLDFFRERKNHYTKFLNKRFVEVIEAYKNVFLMEDVNETILGR